MITELISKEGWVLVDNVGRTKIVSELEMIGVNDHNAYLQKSISIPKSTHIRLDALATRSHRSFSDVQVGLKNAEETVWGSWTGRDFYETNPICQMPEGKGAVFMMLKFAGEWGVHQCKFRDVKLSYVPVEEPEPEPPPDLGIIGQMAAILKQQSDAVEALKKTNTEMVELMSQWGNAQDLIDLYNRSIE